MSNQSLSRSLQENLSRLDGIFGASSDFYTKRIRLGSIPCAITLFTGISSPEKLWVMALDALQRSRVRVPDGPALLDYLLTESVIPAESTAITDMTDLVEKLSNGMSVLLIQGCAGALAVSTQEMPQRAVGQPNGEGDIRGSQEAFTELLRNNISLLRRQFRTDSLVAEVHTADSRAKTEYALCYDRSRVPPALIRTLRRQLAGVRIPVLLDSAYFASFLKKDKLNLFPAAAYTERPATACARLCEGKVVILVSGSPNAMVVPSFFSEHFESLDDYSSGAVFAGLIRILKYIAFLLSVFGPGLYVMAVSFAPETIPIELLAKLARAEAATPLPLMLEMLAITLLLEIVREAGLRAPKSIGHTVSLVGALIVGETAVSAGIVSTPVLTMAAAATVATLAVPSLYEQSILFRFVVILLAGVFGLPGLACGAVVILAMACGTEPFGYDYLYPLMPPGPAAWHDGVVRAIWSTLAGKGYAVDKHERE
ncbi:MAG TPA: spore germination protein [Candidatus Gemmiger stercorigallinarum]|nr:spore germination protein [Candidatus Gemmiger stercorigallinarum]